MITRRSMLFSMACAMPLAYCSGGRWRSRTGDSFDVLVQLLREHVAEVGIVPIRERDVTAGDFASLSRECSRWIPPKQHFQKEDMPWFTGSISGFLEDNRGRVLCGFAYKAPTSFDYLIELGIVLARHPIDTRLINGGRTTRVERFIG